MFVLMCAGLVLVAAGATFAVRHPRAAGEPFSLPLLVQATALW
jgi:hypothetical protein